MNRIICFAAVFAFPCPLFAQEASAPTISLDHVALSVQDADRSVAFYRSVFGLREIENRTEIEGVRWLSLGEGKELHIISVIEGPVTINKAVHFALTTSDFDGFVEVLRRSGIEFSDWPGNAGKISVRADDTRQLYVQDPDGYWIEVNSTASD